MNLLPAEKFVPKVLVKKESSTNKNKGFIPSKRPIKELINYGIVNINKPSGPSSHQVSDYVKKIVEVSKSGHSGTLDPKVTGCLPVALADATRIVQTLLPAGKEYIAIMQLHEDIPKEKIEASFQKFTGEINQLPPVKSAVKRRLRKRNVYYSNLIEIKERSVLFVVGCQAGTYIRKLIHDMGRDLGTNAHMAQLIRTKAGPFNDKKWHTLQDLKDAYEIYKEKGEEKHLREIIEPFENAVKFLPKIWVFDSTIKNLCHGAQLGINGVSKLTNNIKENDLIAIMSLKDELICLAEAKLDSNQILKNEEGLVAKTQKVFMKRDVY